MLESQCSLSTKREMWKEIQCSLLSTQTSVSRCVLSKAGPHIFYAIRRNLKIVYSLYNNIY